MESKNHRISPAAPVNAKDTTGGLGGYCKPPPCDTKPYPDFLLKNYVPPIGSKGPRFKKAWNNAFLPLAVRTLSPRARSIAQLDRDAGADDAGFDADDDDNASGITNRPPYYSIGYSKFIIETWIKVNDEIVEDLKSKLKAKVRSRARSNASTASDETIKPSRKSSNPKHANYVASSDRVYIFPSHAEHKGSLASSTGLPQMTSGQEYSAEQIAAQRSAEMYRAVMDRERLERKISEMKAQHATEMWEVKQVLENTLETAETWKQRDEKSCELLGKLINNIEEMQTELEALQTSSVVNLPKEYFEWLAQKEKTPGNKTASQEPVTAVHPALRRGPLQ